MRTQQPEPPPLRGFLMGDEPHKAMALSPGPTIQCHGLHVLTLRECLFQTILSNQTEVTWTLSKERQREFIAMVSSHGEVHPTLRFMGLWAYND